MADQKLVLDALTEFAHTLVGRYAIVDVLVHLTDQLVPTISLFGAGVSVGDDTGTLRFVTASDDHLIEVERAQEAAQEGPCAECFHTCRQVTSPDLEAETRWPTYRPVALRHGLRSVAAVPLRAGEACIGSLNMFAATPRDWDADDMAIAALFADMAASYVANASDLQRSERIREQLQQALDSRVLLEQAKGLIAGQQGISVELAYNKLREYTRSHNAHLRDVANAVVHLGLRLA
jgi:GAF domain-containing protein